MSSSGEHILLACFDFPPNQGIGGRRWAKLAKGLAQSGFHVHVIKADPIDGNKISPWTEDTVHPNIHVYSFKRKYPQSVSHTGKSLFQKLSYRYHLWRLHRMEKGTVYDIAIGWESIFRAQAEQLIAKWEIKTIIATGAPFNLLLYTARIKQDHPSLRFMADYRDPWLHAVNLGMPQLSKKRREAERQKEKFVFTMADVVTGPSRALLEQERKSVSENVHFNTIIEEIPHFYDPDDIGDTSPLPHEKITLIYGGEMYMGLAPFLAQLKVYLENIKKEKHSLYRQLSVNIFTNEKPEKFGWENDDVIHWSPPIGKNIFLELKKATFCLLFLAHHNKNFFTTKFYEYLPFSKPFIHIGEQGEVANYIREHQLGIVIQDFDRDLTPALEAAVKQRPVVAHAAQLAEQYTLPRVTEKIRFLLKGK